jgi:hypothetical protein
MSKFSVPDSYQGLTRRQVLTGAGGLAVAGQVGAAGGSLNLDDPKDNLTALLKLQADISGKDVIGGFPGEVWGWIPGEGNRLLFRTYGIGASHVEQVEDGWRFYHRELLYYLDPNTNEILQTWENPYTTRRVDVMHILNDPVHRFYPFAGGRFAPPWPYTVMGDDLVFRISVFVFRDSPLSRADYPVHAADDNYQSAELWQMNGRVSEVMNPDITSASCVTSWARVGQWLPFMEMGKRPGVMVYHSDSYKLMGGVADLPSNIREYTEKNHPKYLESPQTWQSLALNQSQVTVSKAEIAKRWGDKPFPVGSVFEQ